MNGEQWKVLRKFFVQKFKEYGFNAIHNDLAGHLYDSINAAIKDLKTMPGKPINIAEFLSKHCAISMRKILFGEKDVTDEKISKMLMAFAGFFDGQGGTNLLLTGPFAK